MTDKQRRLALRRMGEKLARLSYQLGMFDSPRFRGMGLEGEAESLADIARTLHQTGNRMMAKGVE